MNTATILSFLKDLKKHNNRDWFEKNKSRYKEAYEQFLDFSGYIIGELGKEDKQIGLLEPRECVFRIYRDIRFSKDKTPYKNHFGAFFSPEGKSSSKPGYYIHISPGGESFLGGGLYHPSNDLLAKVRQEIDYNASELRKIVMEKNFRKIFGEIQGDALVRPPKGYSEDHPQIELLKLKDYVVTTALKDSEVKEKNFAREAVKMFKVMKPFNDYLSVAIS